MNGQSQVLSKIKHLFTHTKTPSASHFESLLYHYATNKSLTDTKKLHARILVSSLVSSPESSYIPALLASAYALCGDITYGRQLFDELPHRTLHACNTIIKLYTEEGLGCDALKIFVEMLRSGRPRPNRLTYPFVVKACGDLSMLRFGASVHGLIITCGFDYDVFVGNSLLAMYLNCGEVKAARWVFDTIRGKTVVSWNTMLSGYFRNERANEALRVFKKMWGLGLEMDSATIVSVLPSCGHLKDLEVGREVHRLVEEKGLGKYLSVKNALVDI